MYCLNWLKGTSSHRLRQQHPTHVRTYLWETHFWAPARLAHQAR
ncbi:transposase [Mycolicibacterium senegalense]